MLLGSKHQVWSALLRSKDALHHNDAASAGFTAPRTELRHPASA